MRKPSNSVTLNPACSFGIDNRVIDRRRQRADLVIYNHDPLSAYAVVQQTLVDGACTSIASATLPGGPARKGEESLLDKEKKAAEKKPDTDAPKPAEKKPDEKPKPPASAASGGAR